MDMLEPTKLSRLLDAIATLQLIDRTQILSFFVIAIAREAS